MRFFQKVRTLYSSPQGYKEILHVGFPLVVSMSSAAVMQFTDRLFLSHYSIDAIAASVPASAASLTLLLTLMGICGYSTVLIAQYIGSNAPKRVGIALWQGIWCAVAGAFISAAMWFAADSLFAVAGHPQVVQQLEGEYFRVLTVGSGLALLNSAFGAFFAGRGKTRLVMVANLFAALVNIPLDYILIFGWLGFPSLGIIGAGLATVCGWLLCALILGFYIFTPEHEREFHVCSKWRFDWEMSRRLLRFGLPSGFNLFMELIAVVWFIFEIGSLGQIALAASNIAFSINSLVFMPMLGLNMAISALVGQSIGRGKPAEAELFTWRTLHLAFAYMLPFCLIFTLFPHFLITLFMPSDLPAADVASLQHIGSILLFYIAVYSLVDASGIVFFGALKGAGDTLGLMYLLLSAFFIFLAFPIAMMKYFNMVSLHGYWVCFTVYIVYLAGGACWRFRRGRWRLLQVVETTVKPVG